MATMAHGKNGHFYLDARDLGITIYLCPFFKVPVIHVKFNAPGVSFWHPLPAEAG